MEKEYRELSKRLTNIEKMLGHLLAVELFKLDMPQSEIGKQLGVSKASVNTILKGLKKPK